MPLVSQVGVAVKTRRRLDESTIIEWKLRDFFSLSNKIGDYYQSPEFNFADLRWRLKLYPNGVSHEASGFVSLYFMRMERTRPFGTVRYSLGFKGSDIKKSGEKNFSNDEYDWGYAKFRPRSDIEKDKSTLVPNGVLTVTCDLGLNILNGDEVASSNRALKVARNMKTILSEGKRADFTLKLGDRKWPVHKVILESRCAYFENMFRHKWAENSTGEVEFEDMEEDTMDGILDFIYTGNVEKMSVGNVCNIYVEAHRFLLDDLRTLCIHWMRENMCVEIFCEVLVIADTYKEGDLNESAIEYFSQKASKILDSEKWKELKKNNMSLVNEILEQVTKRRVKKRRKE